MLRRPFWTFLWNLKVRLFHDTYQEREITGYSALKCVVQIVDPAAIEALVDKVLADNPKQLLQYRGGKTKLQGFFAGQVWRKRKA